MPAYGRGGAGNIHAVAQEKERIATDLEANAGIQESGTQTDASSIHQGASQQYRHAGRGGAGNYETIADVKEQQSNDEITGGSIQSTTTRTAGRGGAGNYDFAAATTSKAAAREQIEEDLTREIITQKVEENVDQHLAMPPQAKIAHSRSLVEK